METEKPRRHRVLVVDDRLDIRSLLMDVLALLDCDADVASDGKEGLTRFGERPHDLVVTDLAMPGMTGWEFAEAVRQTHPEVGVIVMSGSATERDIDRARAHGFTILEKPIAIADFAAAVGRILEGRARASAELR